MSIEILPWQPQHSDGCLAAFDSNLPVFFAQHERDEFHDFLNTLKRSEFAPDCLQYWTVLNNDTVVGCGGVWINTKESGSPATLIWGLIHQRFHRQGLGSCLLFHRLAWLKGKSSEVLLDTTPGSFRFYEKQGFVKTGFKKNGYQPGLDMVLASFSLTDDSGTR